MDRKAFLFQKAPDGYIPGVGRGATGFTTSADSGGLAFQQGLVLESASEDDEAQNTNNDDGILGSKKHQDKDDLEADKVYEEIERKLMKKKGNKEPDEVTKKDDSVGMKEQFSDLKRALTNVSDFEWQNLPEAGDFTRRNKRHRIEQQQNQRFYAVPDNILAGSGSLGTKKETEGGYTDFKSISEARDKFLGSHLDNLVPQTYSSATEDHTELLESEISQDKVHDIAKSRSVLASLRKSEPHKSSSWIASARLELQAKNYTAAKRIILEGCNKVPRKEHIWLESINIHRISSEGSKLCKGIISEALRYNSTSEKLWLKAYELENSSDAFAKRKMLMNALEEIPNSVEIWKLMIEQEDSIEDVKKLLSKAIQFCPKEWNFWLTLINHSSYSEAKALINRARKEYGSSVDVWITAAKLEERENSGISYAKLSKFLSNGFKEIIKQNVNLQEEKNAWIREAIKSYKEGFNLSAKAAVSIATSIEEIDDQDEFISRCFHLADDLTHENNFEISNYIYELVTERFPHSVDCWVKLFNSLKSSTNDLSYLFSYYRKSIEHNPSNTLLTLMYAKDLWILGNDVDSSRKILEDAGTRLPDDERVWLARVKLEVKNKNFENANRISSECVKRIPGSSASIWYKHIHLQRFLNLKNPKQTYELEITLLLKQSLELFPENYKLILQKSQVLLDDLKKPEEAKDCLSIGVKKCPTSIELWIALANFFEKIDNSLIKSRSTYDKAILAQPESDLLWVERIKLEKRNGDYQSATQLINKSLKIFPKSSYLWVEYLGQIKRSSLRKNAYLDAMQNTGNSPTILLNIGIFFWLDGKFNKAKSWFERALNVESRNGDIWAWLFIFYSKNGTKDEVSVLLEKYKEAYEKINLGYYWNPIHKRVDNLDKNSEEILNDVASTVIKETEVL
ncbi:Piso0_000308 [Millerozyma farinosa CBS 7064]|uniref:Piso0_000308 protein n=1 Tax=Pichia sorbitophila (strain ATCC MYA-4447 / BCRC 22081 / CBS 7064 / NBRC 10061 / NRRL Y-12695) TaxID=559304 RepID=G8YTM6_PICSO|nr:Piso0_000308 [Millerozyma farinosa CBS 7064]